jgi:hypothetical protein
MIDYVTGTLGEGKSAYGVRAIAHALLQGRAVAGNVHLVPGWSELLAAHNPKVRKRDRLAYAREVERRFHCADSLEELTWLKLRGRGEARGLLVLDEAHNELNNREWASQSSKEFLRWLSMLRKKGWRAIIISQHADNTDAGARRLASNEIRMVNWKKQTRVPIIGLEPLPWPVFLALTFPCNLPAYLFDASKIRRREFFWLGWWRKLYDTHELYGENDEGDEAALWLPSDPRERAERAGARADAIAAARLASDLADSRGRRRAA